MLVANFALGPVLQTPAVQEKLKELHPPPQPALSPPAENTEVDVGVFDCITGSLIKKLVTTLKGAQGASGWGTDLLRDLCRDGSLEADALCEDIAKLARRIATSAVLEGHLGPMNRSRMAALDKGNGEVRPIGVGEALRRLVCKAIVYAVREDLQAACGAMQLCAGLPSGCEAGAAALQHAWEDPDVEALILIDARNAFNTLNRAEALEACWKHCPTMGRALVNLYGTPSTLCLEGGPPILSREGTTQGCPAGMAMYGVGSIPLILKVTTDGVIQVWYADDSAGAGRIEDLKRWYDKLAEEGPRRGYFIKLSKTAAIVKPGLEDKFREVFGDLADPEKGGMTVTVGEETEDGGLALGKRYLGVGVGTPAFRKKFVSEKITGWLEEMKVLTKYARSDPHEAYCILTKSIIPSWRYTMRTMPVDPEMYRPLEGALVRDFIPAAFGWEVTDEVLRARVALPVRHGGLALPDPCKLAVTERNNSTMAVKDLTDAILRQDSEYIVDREALKEDRMDREATQDLALSLEAEDIEQRLTGRQQRSLHEARLSGAARWLAAIPLKDAGYALPRQIFRDAVAIGMGLPLPDGLPPSCPSCGEEDADLAHYLSCSKGGWVRRRHTEVQKELARLMKLVCEVVDVETVLPEVRAPFKNPKTTRDKDARTDVMARGLFEPQQDFHTDVVITDTCQNSAIAKGLKPETVLAEAAREKNDTYLERVQRLGGSFIPFAASIYGTLSPEADRIITTIIHQLAQKKGGRKTSGACARLRIQIAIVKATSMCIRTRSNDNNPFGANSAKAQGGDQHGDDEHEEQREEEVEVTTDLTCEWFDLRTTLGE